jgi:MSHA biogenesis protein MshQ
MSGASNSFVVRPFGFYIDVENNPRAESHLGDVFIAASEEFTTKLTAVQWQSGEDANNDGIPDEGADLSDNAATVNFGNEETPETAEISHEFVLPNPSKLGNLLEISFDNFINGTSTVTDMSYDEVGIISFAAMLIDNSYIGTGDVSGNEPFVGRFIPHHFELSIDKEGSLAAVCAAINPDVDYAYIGQVSTLDETQGVLQYLQLPTVTITPQDKLNMPTENYTGDFNQLLLTGITRFQVDNGLGVLVDAPIEDMSKDGADLINKVKITANYFDGMLIEDSGVLSFEYSDQDNFIYTHEQNSEVIPFVSDINLSLASVIDQDGVTALDADDTGDTGIADDTVITLNPIGKEIRFGRAYLQNSFGPETANLPQPFSIQYLNTLNQFVTNELDVCTQFNSANVSLESGTLDKALTGVNAVTGQLDDDSPLGETKAMVLLAPGALNQGTVQVEYDAYSWLKYDWNWNGVEVKTFDENPTAIATFGLFRGNDRIIYQREITQ